MSAARAQIFNHLAVYIPCSKATVLARIKKMLLEKENQALQKPLAKLKAAVERVMPHALREHEQKVAAARASYNASKESGVKPDTQFRSPRRKFPWTDDIRYTSN